VTEKEDYLTSPRTGRKVGLTDTQRYRIWDIHSALTRELDVRGWTTHSRNRQRAAELLASRKVTFRFDAVFVDEAQDLQPSAIRLLVELAKSAEGQVVRLSIAADANQTIYGSGMSWISIHPDLKLQGRSRSLRVNYRSTRQIVEGARAYLADAELEAPDGELSHRHLGPKPKVIFGVRQQDESSHIIDFFRAHSGQMDRGMDMCAVLVPSEQRGIQLQREFLAFGIPAKFMSRREVSLEFEGIKILTRHSAKGLEFPIVAVALASQPPGNSGENEEAIEAIQRERRVNHMAMTRAMRSLLVSVPTDNAGISLAAMDESLWDIEHVGLLQGNQAHE
jgi:superfamily I DNA/RNA helicase